MRSVEMIDAPLHPVELYHLPTDSEWRSDEDVPKDFRQVVELQMMARMDGDSIDSITRSSVSLDDIYQVYDDWKGGQEVLVSRDDDGKIVGMLSYYFESDGTPFFESVAVDPDVQGEGVGGALIDAAIGKVHDTGYRGNIIARAQDRVVGIYERKWGAKVVEVDDKTGLAKITIPL